MARGVEDPALKEQNQGRITRETTETTAAQLPGRAAEVPGADVQGGGQGHALSQRGERGPERSSTCGNPVRTSPRLGRGCPSAVSVGLRFLLGYCLRGSRGII